MDTNSAARVVEGLRSALLAAGVLLAATLPARAAAQEMALVHARVYAAPDSAPLADATILIRGARIAAVGPGLAVPPSARIIDCAGASVTAGFQNSHVHFTLPQWAGAGDQPAAKLQSQLADMLTRYGFVTVVDLGSDPRSTFALRARIEDGSVTGPRILSAGGALYPQDGIPYYLRNSLPAAVLPYLDQPATPADAARIVERDIAGGADLIKLFTGSLVEPSVVKPMRVEVAAAAVAAAHRHGRLVFTHPSNLEGIRIAVEAGVDVLAHTASDGEPWNDALIADLRRHDMAVVPTLKLWIYVLSLAGVPQPRIDRVVDAAAGQLAAFVKAGGQVLFGTDVGYMTDFDPADEYALMEGRAGLSPMQILASLTTAPAARFGEADRRGRVAAGMDADLVVLDADPGASAAAFTRVRTAIRAGRIIWSRPR